MRERLFFLATVPLSASAGLCGLVVRAPHPVPEYALQAVPVYRAEVALATFAAGYLIAICIRLAWHGRTFTRLGSTIEVPEVHRRLEADVASLTAAIQSVIARNQTRGQRHLFAVDDPDDDA